MTSGLRPPRVFLEDLREFTRWCKAQVIPSALSELIDDIGATSDTDDAGDVIAPLTELDRAWTFVDFAVSTTLQKAHQYVMMRSTSGSAVNLTVPADQDFDLGAQISVFQQGAGQVTIVAASGVTINTPTTLKINEQYGTITLIQEFGNTWFIAGRMAS